MHDPQIHSTYHLRLLGGFRLTAPDGAEVRITGKKAQALLAYLALHPGREVSRETLATLLWGDRQDEQARQSLRQSLTELRRALDGNGEVLHAEGEGVSLNGGMAVDALTFAEAAGNGDEHLEQAANLYEGPLLEGARVDAEGFNVWLEAERERLHRLACTALQRLADNLAQAGDADAAMDTATRLLTLEPANEEAHRLLMRLHAAAGRRTEALRQYQLCEEALRRELDVAPSEETRRVYDGIREGVTNGVAATTPGISPRVEITSPPSRRRWVLGVVAGIVLVIVTVGLLGLFQPPTKERSLDQRFSELLGGLEIPEKPSIAVLPFRNLSDDPKQRYFADGLAADIIGDLSRYNTLFVISQTASFRYRGEDVDLRKVSTDLGVRYVLDGTMRKANGRIRVNTQLIDATTGQNIWGEQYERPETDFFTLQDEITDKVVVSLEVELLEGRQTLARRKATASLEAYYLYRRADELWNMHTKEANAEGIEAAKKAIEIDPQYATAHGILGHLYTQVVYESMDQDKLPWIKRAGEVGENIKALNTSEFVAQQFLSFYIFFFLKQRDEGFLIASQTYRNYPSDSDAIATIGTMNLLMKGGIHLGIEQLKRSIRIEPFPESWKVYQLGRALIFSGENEQAITAFEKTLSITPGYTNSLVYLVGAYMLDGKTEKAREAAKNIPPDFRLGTYNELTWRSAPHLKDRIHQILRAIEAAGIPWE